MQVTTNQLEDLEIKTSTNNLIQNIRLEELNASEFRYGIWRFKQERNTYNIKGISKEGILEMLSENGYYKRYVSESNFVLIHDRNNIITEVNNNKIQDFFMDYIYSIEDDLEIKYRVYNISIGPQEQRDLLLKEISNLFNYKFLSLLKTHSKNQVRDSTLR